MVRFNGQDYVPEHDDKRLTNQIKRIFGCMFDNKWRTLREIAEITNDPEASISAQLRHLRKPRFGSFIVNKRRRGCEGVGLFEYQLLIPSE